MALVHEFTTVKNEQEITFDKETRKQMLRIDDYFILYIMDTLIWVSSYWGEIDQEKIGINYYGVTIFKEKGITQLLNLIDAWESVFEVAPDSFELSTGFSVEEDRYYKEGVKKDKLLEQIKRLKLLCSKALDEKKLLVHFGI